MHYQSLSLQGCPSCLLYRARSHLRTQSSVTLTPLSRALKWRDGNWSSPLIKRFFYPWLQCSAQLSCVNFQSSNVICRGTVPAVGLVLYTHRYNSTLQPVVHQLDDKDPAECCSSWFWRLQNDTKSLYFPSLSLPGDSPRCRNTVITGHS